MCGRRRIHVFDTAEECCQWTFKPEHENYIFIAHNFKSYNSYPILEWLIEQGKRPFAFSKGGK
jgi:hypothetical protein